MIKRLVDHKYSVKHLKQSFGQHKMQMYTVALSLIIYALAAANSVYCSEKKGVVHWAPSYKCDDFKVLNNMTWWYDFRMSLSYFHDKEICSSTIDTYRKTHVPMVWGYWSNTKIQIAGEAKFILGFNEPNHKNQSNMTPKRAADAWPEVERNSKGKALVSPSAAACGKHCLSDDITWFDEFFKLCNGCRVDFIATHTYWCNANQVMAYLKKLYERYGRHIWLTEFACSRTNSPKVQLNFMKQLLPKLESAHFIYRYSWYSARITESGFVTQAASLLEPNRSTLTALGKYYNDFQGVKGPSTAASDGSNSTKHREREKERGDVNKQPVEIGKDETLLILKAFTSNPTPWRKMLRYMQGNVYQLPQKVRDFYNRSSKQRRMKKRIKRKLKEVLCTDIDKIADKDIRDIVQLIRKFPTETAPEKKKRKNDENLRVPPCTRA